MWELDYKESWALKSLRFWTVVLEKTLESPLDSKDIQPVHPKGSQSWMFIGRTAVEAEPPILWPPDAKSWLIWKDPDAGKDWRWEGDNRGWDGWMASPTQWTWVWVNSRSWWWTGRPGVLQSIGSLRVGHAWATELNWTVVVTAESTGVLIHKPSSATKSLFINGSDRLLPRTTNKQTKFCFDKEVMCFKDWTCLWHNLEFLMKG